MASCELTISLADFGLDPIEGAQVSAQGVDGSVFRDGQWLIGVSETAATDAGGVAVLTVPQMTDMVIRASVGAGRPASVRITTPATATAALADIVGEAAPSGQAFSAAVYDAVKALIAAGSNITLTADDATGTLTLAASGTLSGSVSWDVITDKPAAFTPSAHTHEIAEVVGLQDALDALGAVTGGGDGVGIASMSYDAVTGVWTATMTDASTYSTGDLRGPQGEQGLPGSDGADGAPGADGSDGADGASAYEIAVSAGFIGTEAEWLASLVGPAGPAGADGSDGADGASAYAVALSLGFIGTEAEWLASLVGPAGADGAPGADGADGQSVTITIAADQAAFDAATPGPLELVVLNA